MLAMGEDTLVKQIKKCFQTDMPFLSMPHFVSKIQYCNGNAHFYKVALFCEN